jgi:hypothetical protein
MRLTLIISLSLLLLPAWQAARAQSADDYFNSGAHSYISNNIPEALKPVEQGLKLYPDDEKLKKLYDLLKKQQQQQNQQKQQQQNNQSKQNQQNQKNQQQQQNQQQKQNEQNQKSEQQKQAEKQQQENQEAQQTQAGQMTPEEAKRLLDAQKDNEQILQWKPEGKPEDQNRVIKDW